MRDEIIQLVHIKNPRDFIQKFYKIKREKKAESFLDECLKTLGYIYYKNKYPRFVHHAYMGLMAAKQAMPYLKDEKDKELLVFQYLYYCNHESKNPFLSLPEKQNPAINNLQAILKNDLGFLDFARSAINKLENSSTRKQAIEELIDLSVFDFVNIGHKSIYLLRSLETAEIYQWKTIEPYLISSLHYLYHAPDEGHLYDTSGDMTDTKVLEEEQIQKLNNLFFEEQFKNFSRSIREHLDQSVQIENFFSYFFKLASELILRCDPKSWIYPVHSFNYCYSIYYISKYIESPIRKFNLIISLCHYFILISKKTKKVGNRIDINKLKINKRSDYNSFLDVMNDSDVEENYFYIKESIDKNQANKLKEELVRKIIKYDAYLHFSHDIKYLISILKIMDDCDYDDLLKHFLAFSKFISEGKKSNSLYLEFNKSFSECRS